MERVAGMDGGPEGVDEMVEKGMEGIDGGKW